MPKDNEAMNSGNDDNAFRFAGLTNLANCIPGMETLVDIQRRNAEALTQASQHIFQGFQELMQRQQEMLRDYMSESSQMMGRMMQPGAPQEKISGHAEAAKSAMEKAAANSKELFEMATGCQMRAATMVTSRMGEAFQELRSASSRK